MWTALGNGSSILFLFLYLTIYGLILYPYGLTDESTIELVGLLTQSMGIISGVATSFLFISKPEWMPPTTILIPITAFIATILYDIAAVKANTTLVYIGAGLIGLFTAPIFTVSYEIAVH